METKEYRYIDKSEWDRGEWDDEPDKVQWQDKATGLPCLIVRNKIGTLCGYVGIPEGHPYFEKDSEDDVVDVRCHGGLTFSGHCQEHDKEHGICHVPAPGEPDNVWWLGFDCAHAFDLMPHVMAHIRNYDTHEMLKHDVYRNLAYVKNECRKLARQLAAVIAPPEAP